MAAAVVTTVEIGDTPGRSSVLPPAVRRRSARAGRLRPGYFHRSLAEYCRLLIPPGSTVLKVGDGAPDLLGSVRPSVGVGLEVDADVARRAANKYPALHFVVGRPEQLPVRGTFDYVLVVGVGMLDDVQRTLEELAPVMRADTRVVVACYNSMWEPVVYLAEALGVKERRGRQNWLSPLDQANFLLLANLDVVRRTGRVLLPLGVPGLAWLLNRVLSQLPGLRALCLLNILVARPRRGRTAPPAGFTCSIIVPARNEEGNIVELAARIPQLGPGTEVIFVDGASTDGTAEVIEAIVAAGRRGFRFQFLRQETAAGKGDAVRRGFAAATGDIVMILDSDLSVAPEDLTKFYRVLAEGKGEFANGSRLVYPLEKQAMRLLNMMGNKLFSALFTWLLEQPFRDTLCGTKALFRDDYERIAGARSYFGDFDPFGDFDLIFGAVRLNLKVVEIPVRYYARRYGTTKISRFQHGWLLFRMCGIAARKLKFC